MQVRVSEMRLESEQSHPPITYTDPTMIRLDTIDHLGSAIYIYIDKVSGNIEINLCNLDLVSDAVNMVDPAIKHVTVMQSNKVAV